MEIEDKIKLTHIPEVLIQYLHERMYQLQYYELVIIFVHNCNEVETCISFVYDLVFFVVDEIAHFWLTSDD